MKQIINILVFLLLASCGQSTFAQTPVTNSFQSDTVELKETINEEDLPINDYLTDKLKPIRENFKRINSITNWSSIKTLELWETTEGGEAKFYYQNGQLEKIVTQNFGEMGQSLTEYYLLDEKLSFVFEKWYKYNRPITWNENHQERK